MHKYEPRFPRRDYRIDEDNVVAEILEDIECLDIVDSDYENTDLLNDDTFGDLGDTQWDPTETFMEAERLKNVVTTKPRRTTTELEKFNDFDFFLKKPFENKHIRRDNNIKKRDIHKRNISPINDEQPTDPEERIWEDDIKKLRNFGLFELTFEYIDKLKNSNGKIPDKFKISQITIERHVKCVERNEKTYEKEYFMNSSEFDKILRIQLAQVSKDPKLQSYSGKWNLYHLGVKKPQEDNSESSEDNSNDDEDNNNNENTPNNNTNNNIDDNDIDKKSKKNKKDKKNKNKSNRFGKTSAASIRHGRKLIYLGGDNSNLNDLNIETPKVYEISKDKLIRSTIESCYETLYILCDVEQEIEKCPMNHVSALDKMQKDRDEYLQDLFTLLTGNLDIFVGILGLNKGRLLTSKIGRKLGIVQKLLLLSTLVSCLERFVEICQDVDIALINENNLSSFIELATNPHNLKSLVAFEGSGSDNTNISEATRLQHLLFNYSSLTRLYLFIVEGLTLTGHLFLLTGNNGRHTALQRCSNILINAQQQCKGFEKILTTRAGVVFTNIFLQRIRTNAGAVDQNSVDVLLHYTLDVSERIEANQQDWNSLASNIVKMF